MTAATRLESTPIKSPELRAVGARESRLSERELAIVRALAEAAIPPGETHPGGGEITVRRFERWLGDATPQQLAIVRGLLWTAEMSTVPTTGRTLTALPRERAMRFLEDWADSRFHARRALLRAILSPVKVAHFDDASMFAAVGCPSFHEPRVKIAESARWMQQVTDGKRADEDLGLECEVVVVGTGAGGAAIAYELASRGRAVLLLEEGDYLRRDASFGKTQHIVKKVYRDQGMTIALGNVGIPIFAGRAVGGSTVVNSGTCYRAPERVFTKWREELGLTWFSSASMDPYYRRVEAMLGVTRAKVQHTGGVGRVVARGADKLGWVHHPLDRNAPDCDGQGVCVFGCPTGAKRSTDVSYVPEALLRGAQLVTAARVEGIDVVAGKARGVRGTLGSGKRFTVKAEVVVVAGGALMTPVILKKAGLCTRSAYLGRNLSIHPCTKVLAVFDEDVHMGIGIPQGYCVEQFKDEGLMLEGGSMPLDVTALGVPWVGRRFMRVLDQYPKLATFGLMIDDTSRGTVREGVNGSPLITYNLNAKDASKMRDGIAAITEVFLAAGARRVLPLLPDFPEVTGPRDLARLKAARVRPSDIEVTAYHPLGTCRIGTDPRTSVVGPDFEAHECQGLYVTDGAAIPTSLGVNPQLTIMAMALRAGEIIDARLS